jgi:3-hydroxyacyl-CoA dehydrogenase
VASAGVPVVLLDIPGKEDRNEWAKKGLERALKAKPAAFMDPDLARYVEIGNTEDHLEKLKDCDWVVEAIIEKPEPKQALYARLEGLLKPTAIVSSNTSGIPMKILLEGRSEAFRKRFLGTHFFNPPRYLHLLGAHPHPRDRPQGVGGDPPLRRAHPGQGDRSRQGLPRLHRQPAWGLRHGAGGPPHGEARHHH